MSNIDTYILSAQLLRLAESLSACSNNIVKYVIQTAAGEHLLPGVVNQSRDADRCTNAEVLLAQVLETAEEAQQTLDCVFRLIASLPTDQA
ncbi:hypothetical protein LJC32_01440 [Oscillospiraceae bacterium OttesenSCG-928-F05]|nr:hypothetical protein [Oscillospiraceae bacterium OttesenSCG-928-F05]